MAIELRIDVEEDGACPSRLNGVRCVLDKGHQATGNVIWHHDGKRPWSELASHDFGPMVSSPECTCIPCRRRKRANQG